MLVARSSFLTVLMLLLLPARAWSQPGWGSYGGDAGGQRFSASRVITPANVGRLKKAWTFHTHAMDVVRPRNRMASFEATPVLWHGTLYFTTPFDKVFAIDAVSGKQKWSFDPKPELAGGPNLTTSRGVTLWHGKGQGMCENRVLIATLDARVWAVDATTGRVCTKFGTQGNVDLKPDVGIKQYDVYEITSAPTVVGDTVIVGSSIPDGVRVNELRGTVHALDVRTGRMVWKWDPIGSWAMKQPEEVRTGAANAWSTISADPALGLIYIPTGSASPEYYGGLRRGDNRDANSVVALEAKTGRRVWGFQVVHHDLWDYDMAAEPVLFSWRGTTPAVAVSNKMGEIFVLDRRTGVPLLPVEERPVPMSDVPGEDASPTQPFSSVSTAGPIDLNAPGEELKRSLEESEDCRMAMQGRRYEGPFTPPSLRGSLQYPGSIGGINWGGMAYDPTSQVLYANDNNDIYEVDLIPRKEMEGGASPSVPQRKRWIARFLAITGHKKRIPFAVLLLLIAACAWRKRWYPGMPALAIAATVLLLLPLHRWVRIKTEPAAQALAPRIRHANAFRGDAYAPQIGTPYWLHVKPVSDREGKPCTKLPWGSLVAIDMNSGKRIFRVPHGPNFSGQQAGSLSVSGPIVTAGGLVFSAGTRAPVLYAYDSTNGRRLAELPLPGPAQATPMSYQMNGKQYVVIAVGGHGPLELVQGDSVVAYALP